MFDYLLLGYAFLCSMFVCIQGIQVFCRAICFKEMSKLKTVIYFLLILSNGYIFFISISKCFAYFALFIKTL